MFTLEVVFVNDEGRDAFTAAFYNQLDGRSDEPDPGISEQDGERQQDLSDATESGSGADGVDVQDRNNDGRETGTDRESSDDTIDLREAPDEGATTESTDSQVESSGSVEPGTASGGAESADQIDARRSGGKPFRPLPNVYDTIV